MGPALRKSAITDPQINDLSLQKNSQHPSTMLLTQHNAHSDPLSSCESVDLDSVDLGGA